MSIQSINFNDLSSVKKALSAETVQWVQFERRLCASGDLIDSLSDQEKLEILEASEEAMPLREQSHEDSATYFEGESSNPLIAAFNADFSHEKAAEQAGAATYMVMRSGLGKRILPVFPELIQGKIFTDTQIIDLSTYLDAILYTEYLDEIDIYPFKTLFRDCSSIPNLLCGEGFIGRLCKLGDDINDIVSIAAHPSDSVSATRNLPRLAKTIQNICLRSNSDICCDGKIFAISNATPSQRKLLLRIIFQALSAENLESCEHGGEASEIVFGLLGDIPHLLEIVMEAYYEKPREERFLISALVLWLSQFSESAKVVGFELNADEYAAALDAFSKALEHLPPGKARISPLYLYGLGLDFPEHYLVALGELFNHVNGDLEIFTCSRSMQIIVNRWDKIGLESLSETLISMWLLSLLVSDEEIPQQEWLSGRISKLTNQSSNAKPALQFIMNTELFRDRLVRTQPLLFSVLESNLYKISDGQKNPSIVSIVPSPQIRIVKDHVWEILNESERLRLETIHEYLATIRFSEDATECQSGRRGFLTDSGVLVENLLKIYLEKLILDLKTQVNLNDRNDPMSKFLNRPMLGNMITVLSEPKNRSYLKRYPDWSSAVSSSKVYQRLLSNPLKKEAFKHLTKLRNTASHEDFLDDFTVWSTFWCLKNDNILGELLVASRNPISLNE